MSHIKMHGSLVMYHGAGVLITGASGSGKSDLALRLIHEGGQLVSDDQVMISKTDLGLVATAPQYIRGLLEIRGIGVIRMETAPQGKVDLVVSLMDDLNEMERMPVSQTQTICDIDVPKWDLYPFEASATAKVKKIVDLWAKPDDLMG